MHGPHDSAATTQAAGHRIKSFEPLTLDSAPMSPQRLGLPRITFNYFDDTLETEPTAYLPSRLPMPQATEKARNERAQQRRGPLEH